MCGNVLGFSPVVTEVIFKISPCSKERIKVKKTQNIPVSIIKMRLEKMVTKTLNFHN